jgi:hypothetical protein
MVSDHSWMATFKSQAAGMETGGGKTDAVNLQPGGFFLNRNQPELL